MKKVFCLFLAALAILGCLNAGMIAFADDSWRLPQDPPGTVYGTGYIPADIEYPPQPIRFTPSSTADPRYPTGVAYNNMTTTIAAMNATQSPVQDQGNTGLCWSFASMGAIEARTIRAGGSSNPLSPAHAGHALSTAGGNSIYGFYNRQNPGDGGNPIQIMHYAKRDALNGFVRFNDDTTNLSGGISPRPVATTQAINRSFVVPGAYHINTGRASVAEIKTAIVNYGAVTTTMFGDNINQTGAYWNQDNAAYYQPPSSPTGPDHLVLIVGWDNDYPRSYFSTDPGANGAWLVKNSWGTGFGQNGYFWISFADKHAGMDSWVFDPARPITASDNTNKVYDYNSYGAPLARYSVAWFGTNVFTAGSSNETLTQVRVFVNSAPQNGIRIFLTNNYTAPSQVAGTIAASPPIATFNANYVGYYTVDISSPPTITANSNFAISVSNQVEVPVSQIRPGTPPGRSFIGPSSAQQDIGTDDGRAALIKAVTSPASGSLTPTITAQPQSQIVAPGQSVSFTVFASGSPAPTFQWQRSTGSGAAWTDVPGATSATLTLPGVELSDSGSRFRCIVTNSEGAVTSVEVTLTVSAGGFGPNPGTGIDNMAGAGAAMTMLIVTSAALWGYIIIKRRKSNV